MIIELTDKEVNTLLGLCESVEPCSDCDKDIDCGIYQKGYCKAKNAEQIARKIKNLILASET